MDERITLALTAEAVNLILEGLAQLPLVRAMPLFREIKQEAARQIEQQKENHG